MLIDTIIENAKIVTMDEARPRAHSIGINHGVIVGVDDELTGITACNRVNAHGATVVPGFNDAHAHSVWFGLTLIEADVSGATALNDIYDVIAAAAARSESDGWIIASGLNHHATGGQYPDRDALDRVSNGRPVWIKHSSGHACVLNGVALKLVGAENSAPPVPSGGRVVVDNAGRPTGLLEETAMSLVQALVLPYPLTVIEDALAKATTQYAREGLTSVTDAGIAGGWIGHSPREFAGYQNAKDAGTLRSRMQVMISLDALEELPGHSEDSAGVGLSAGIRSGAGDEWLQIGPTKIFTDGSLLASTALMTEHYEGAAHNHGYLQGDPDSLRERALAAHRTGWALALHAIGDGALDFALDILESARKDTSSHGMPNRIEHGGVIRPDQMQRLAESGASVVPQPHFIRLFGDGMIERLGAERAQWSYRARSFLDAGVVLPGSSDRPVAPGAPLAVMQSFVERLTQSGASYGEGERITAYEALRAYTVGSAAATGWASRKGTLARGMLADLVVLGDSPVDVRPDQIGQIEVVATIVGGLVSHDASGLFSAVSSVTELREPARR
ncbi:amidohydrolase [Salinibacterium sp. NYA9b]